MPEAGFIRDTWYVAARSEDIGPALTPLRLLGEQVVMFRRPDGKVAALEDACPHRKLPLSQGKLEGANVVCGYHGLTFDGTGTCVAAPTQPDSIPRRARVASYPVAERYGFVWIWMGQPDAADPAQIIDIPHFDAPGWAATPRGAMDIACHYLWIADNLLDPSHVAWVHVSSFGGAGTDNSPLEITEGEDGLTVWRWIMDQPPPPYYKPLLPFGERCDRKQHYEIRLPATAINKSVYTAPGKGGGHAPDNELPDGAFINNSYNFMTPVDEDHSLYFWVQHRNGGVEDEAMSQRMFEGARMAFLEDKAILEAVHEGMKHKRTGNINLGLDAGAMRFRRMVARRIEAEAQASEASVSAG